MTYDKINTIDTLNELNLFTDETVTASVQNGGAVTFQIKDLICFIFDTKQSREIILVSQLLDEKKASREAIITILKKFVFDLKTASSFVVWQREISFSEGKTSIGNHATSGKTE